MFFEPILFFLLLRKKRTVSSCQEKKEGHAKPEVHPVPPSDFHTPRVQGKALVERESPENRPKGSLVVSFLFFTGARRFFSFSEKRKKRMGAQVAGRTEASPPCKLFCKISQKYI